MLQSLTQGQENPAHSTARFNASGRMSRLGGTILDLLSLKPRLVLSCRKWVAGSRDLLLAGMEGFL